EFPKLARIYNLHRKYRDILVDGMVLSDKYGPNAVSRGDDKTRIVTLRNLTWDEHSYNVKLDEEIGMVSGGRITLAQLHPTEKVIGIFNKGDEVMIDVLPFRSCMLLATTREYDEPALDGIDYRVIKNVKGKPVEIEILGMPGTKKEIRLFNTHKYKSARIEDDDASRLLKGKTMQVNFPGEPLAEKTHRKLGDFGQVGIPDDAEALYEATVFAADNNALEVRSLHRSGETSVPEVKAARDAFFNQKTFVERGVWDYNLFDSNPSTGFWQTRRYRTERGCLRLDLGEVIHIDELLITVPEMFSLLPLLPDEGNIVEVSQDLKNWEQITYMSDLNIRIPIDKEIRFLRFRSFPQHISEIEGIASGRKLDRSEWRASNLFEYPSNKKAEKAWITSVVLDEVPEGSYLCIAINGKHGTDGAYAAARVDGELIGAPDRSPSFLSNPWESFNPRPDKNYTYYIPVKEEYKGKTIEVYVFGYDKDNLDLEPELWITAYPYPWEKIKLVLESKF
ncbi:MAG: hypothetical protein JW965_05180, partial [Bacteroidales bacterium]|nr:hypothetical protein [Bacteroidales bacterium]